MTRSPALLVVPALFLAAVFAWSINPYRESDAFYHLKTGQVVWENKSIPDRDIFSYTAEGVPWVTHEWLSELAFYGTHAFGGFWGVILFVALLSLLTYGLLFRLAVWRGAEPVWTGLLLFLCGYFTFNMWIGRPQVWTYLAFTLLFFLLERHRFTGDRKYLWGIPFLFLVWANLHAAFLLGFPLLGWYVLAAFARKYWDDFGGEYRAGAVRDLAVVLSASAFVSLLNPHGYHAFAYGIYIQEGVEALRITEWQPIQNFAGRTWARAFLFFLAVGQAFLVWWLGIRKASRDWTLLGLTFALAAMPFFSVRHRAFWPLVTGYILTVETAPVFAEIARRFSSRVLLRILLALGAVFLGYRLWILPPEPIDTAKIPVHAADFMEAQELAGPRFNAYNEGGYLIWRSWPDQKVFVDGRSEVFAGRPIRELITIVRDGEDWHELVDRKYGINHMVLAYRPKELGDRILPLVRRLMVEGWPLVYWDDAALVFVRNIPQHRETIERYSLRHVSPYRDPASIPPEETEAALAEIGRLLDAAPNTLVVQDYALQVLESRERMGYNE